MIPPVASSDEGRRQDVERQRSVVDLSPEEGLDDLAKLATIVGQASASLILFNDGAQIRVQSAAGTELSTPLVNFLGRLDFAGSEMLVIPDASLDPRFREATGDNGSAHWRFFASVALKDKNDGALGFLWVVASEPRQLTDDQRQGLVILARQIVLRLDFRSTAREFQSRERLLKTIMDAELECVKLLGPDGSLRMMNRGGLAMIEADSFEQVAGKSVESLIIPQKRIAFAAMIQRVFRGESATMEYGIIGLKGSERWLETHATPLRDAQGQVTDFLAVTRDITLRHRAEKALREREASFETAQRIAHFGSWELRFPVRGNQRAAVLHWCDEMYRIAGFTPGEMEITREKFFELVHPDDRELVREAAQTAIREHKGYSVTHRLIRPDGEERIIRETAQVIYDDQSGLPWKFIGMAHDITAEFRAQHELERSEQELRKLASELEVERARLLTAQAVAKVGSWETNLISFQVEWSSETHRIFETAPETYRPTHSGFLELVHPEDRAFVEETFLCSLHPRGRGACNYRLLLPGDQIKFIEANWQVLCNEAGRPIRTIGTCQDITDRKRAEAEVEVTMHLLQAIADATPNAVFVKDREGRYLLFNKAAVNFVGRSAKEVIGRDDTAIFSLEDSQIVAADDREVMNSGVARTFEETLTAAGVTRVYAATKVPFRDAQGQVIGLIGISRDITDRKEAENALRESEERFRLLAKATNDAIWDWDVIADRVWWNEGLEVLFGFLRNDVEPGLESWSTRLHPDDAIRVHDYLRACISQGQTTFSDEYRFRRNDGSYAYVLSRGNILRNDSGQPVRVIGGMTDLTDRLRAEQQIAEQAALIDQAHDAILVHDLEHHITFWSKGAERLFGWTAEEAVGQRFDQLLQLEATRLQEAERALSEHSEWSGELQKINRAGQRVTVDSRWTLLHDDDGTPRRYLHIDTDITERKRIEQQFLRTQRMESIGTLAGGIAHDLNNVLGPIILSLDILRMRFTDPASAELLGIIGSNANRGADMVRQVLSYARGVEGRRIEIQLAHIIREIEKIGNETFLKHIQIQAHIAEDLWMVLGDPTQLHQVLLNLSLNARDAMPEAGILTLSAENITIDAHYAGLELDAKPGRYVRVRVEDTGSGMPAAIMEKIFDPFFTTKDIGKGTGLGLSTSLAIVKSHAGFIRVYSEIGRGSKFQIYLPALSEPAVEKVIAPVTALPRGNGELILIVDDENSVRLITQQTLETYGYRAIVAREGTEAIAIYAQRNQEIALVLTDIMMPMMDGAALIQVLRKINPKVRIIAASGLAANRHLNESGHLGVKYFLHKPYSAEVLLKTLKKALRDGAGEI